jgi:alkylation response protein AidB-like acyl-CoA dehydrogenase
MPSAPNPASTNAAEALEAALGDPRDAAAPISFARAVALDEAEQYPEDAAAALAARGVTPYFLPPEHGGRLRAFDELVGIVRAVARRDLTLAIALGQTYLGAVHVWIAGSPEQRRRVAELILAGKQMAFALTERDHGGDVLASDVRADAVEGGLRLTGEKWLINNGTRGAALTVFARTEERGGLGGFSLVLFDRERADAATWTAVPPIRTLGLRGADISGVRFDGCLIPAEAVIDGRGKGFEIALKGLMVTRVLCAGFSLGAGDTALRSTVAFALDRRIYGANVLAIPHARDVLAESFADLLIAEAVGQAGCRGLHVAPGQTSVWSAVTKYIVPTTVETAIGRLATVLGARYYLRQEHEHGIFQKMSRDNAVVSLFDGSTAVNLGILATQLGQLLRAAPHADAATTLTAAFDPSASLAEPDLSRLTLFAGGRDDVVQGLPSLLAHIARLASPLPLGAASRPGGQGQGEGVPGDGAGQTTPIDPEVATALEAATRALIAERDRLAAELATAASTMGGALPRSAEGLDLARRYALLFAGAAALHRWRHGRASDDAFARGGDWLVLGLHRLLDALRIASPRPSIALRERVAARMLELHQQDRSFSLVPIQLGRGAGGAAP